MTTNSRRLCRSKVIFLVGSLLCSSTATAADCTEDETVTNQTLTDQINEVEQAMMDLNVDKLKSGIERLDSMLGCMTEILDGEVAAGIHRMHGISTFGARDLENAHLDFAAARSADEAYSFPLHMVPPGNPLLQAYSAYDLDTSVWQKLPTPPAGGELYIDGFAAEQRSGSWPSVVQYLYPPSENLNERLAYTVRVTAEQEIPSFPEPPAPTVAPTPKPTIVATLPGGPAPVEQQVQVRSAKGPLWTAAALSAVAAGGLYGLGYQRRTQWDDPNTPMEDLADLQRQTNGLAIGAGFAGAAALGFGIGGSIAPSKRRLRAKAAREQAQQNNP